MTVSVINVISTIVNFYVFLIIIYVLLSWFPHQSGAMYDIYNAFGKICEPYLALFRKIMPPIGGLDFSPIAAILVLEFVMWLIVRLIH